MEIQRSRTAQVIARVLVTILGAGFLVSLAPAVATASPAYPIVTHCHFTIDPPNGQVQAGGTFRVSGTSDVSTTFTASFNGETRNFSGTSFTTTFRVPKTKTSEKLTLRVSCTADAGQFTLFNVQILGSGTGHGHLPNTGGPSIWWLILAAMAGVAGSFLMWRGRRRPQADLVAAHPGKHVLRD